MFMYRPVTYEEFEKLSKNILPDKKDYDGMHFFKYGVHAKMYLPHYGKMIIGCDIPNYLIREMDYVNHPFKNFFVNAPIPQYIIKKDDFDSSFITETNPEIKKMPDYADGEIYNDFLECMYNEWTRNTKNWYGNVYGFYDYVVEFLKGKDLDETMKKYGNPRKRVKK